MSSKMSRPALPAELRERLARSLDRGDLSEDLSTARELLLAASEQEAAGPGPEAAARVAAALEALERFAGEGPGRGR